MKPTYEELEAQIKQMEADNEKALSVLKEANDAVLLAKSKFEALAAENAALKEACGGDGNYRDCPACAHSEYIEAPETPATDAFLAEVRASAIPEGYMLVPQQIFLEPSDIESICSQCGDGHESGYGDFTDGLLWVGNIQRDDGSIVHGLHISSADYSEEGGVTVCEFAAQLRKGVQS